MKYFVRFTQGDNAAIGFHDIPVDGRAAWCRPRPSSGTPAVARLHPAAALPTRGRCGASRPLGTTVVVTA